MKLLLKNERGAITVISVFAMTAMVALLALVIDFGSIYLEKSKLQKTVDAAVLAGAQELPKSYEKAKAEAIKAIEYNEGNSKHFTFHTNAAFTEFEVIGINTASFFFAKALGIEETDIQAKAKATLQPLTGVNNAIPLGVKTTADLSYGTFQKLKVSDSTNGNFGAIELTGNGASGYETDLRKGYSKVLTVGDTLSYENGKMTQKTIAAIEYRIGRCPDASYDNFSEECERVVFVPVIKQSDSSKKDVIVDGFATFFIEGVSSASEGAEVYGRFINMIVSGESSAIQNDYGTYVLRLTR